MKTASFAFAILVLPALSTVPAKAGALYLSAQVTQSSGQDANTQTVDNTSAVAATQGAGGAYAAGDVGAGALTVAVHAPSPAGTGSTGTSYSDAEISDDLHFTVAGATDTTVTLLTFSILLTANYTLDDAAFQQNLNLHLGSSSVNQIISQYHDSELAASVSETGLQSYQVIQNSVTSFDFIGTYALVGANPDLQIGYQLTAVTDGGLAGNFSSVFGLLMPENATFISDSGSRYPQVPEPAGWPLFMESLFALAIAHRTRIGISPPNIAVTEQTQRH